MFSAAFLSDLLSEFFVSAFDSAEFFFAVLLSDEFFLLALFSVEVFLPNFSTEVFFLSTLLTVVSLFISGLLSSLLSIPLSPDIDLFGALGILGITAEKLGEGSYHIAKSFIGLLGMITSSSAP